MAENERDSESEISRCTLSMRGLDGEITNDSNFEIEMKYMPADHPQMVRDENQRKCDLKKKKITLLISAPSILRNSVKSCVCGCRTSLTLA